MDNCEEKDDKWCLNVDGNDSWRPSYVFDNSSDDVIEDPGSSEMAEKEPTVDHMNKSSLLTNPPTGELKMRENALHGYTSNDVNAIVETADLKNPPYVKSLRQGCEEVVPDGNNLKKVDHFKESDSTDDDQLDVDSSDQNNERNGTWISLKAMFWLMLTLLFIATAVIPRVAYFISIITDVIGYMLEQRLHLKEIHMSRIFWNYLNLFATSLKYNAGPPAFSQVSSAIMLFGMLMILTKATSILRTAKIEFHCSLGKQLKEYELHVCINGRGMNKKSTSATEWVFKKFRPISKNLNITVFPAYQTPTATPNNEKEAEEYSDPASIEPVNEANANEANLNLHSLEQTEQDYDETSYEPTIITGTETEDNIFEDNDSSEAPPPPDSGYGTTELWNATLDLFKIMHCPVLRDPQNPGCLLIPKYQLKKVYDVTILNGNLESFLQFVKAKRTGGIIIDKTMQRDVKYGRFERDKQYTVFGKSQSNFICKTKRGLQFMMKKIPRKLFNVDQIRNYVQPGIHQNFLPKMLGVIVDQEDVNVLLSYRKGVDMRKVLARKVWDTMDKLMFITYLLQGVQALHKQGIALLGIHLSSLELEDVHNLSSLRFTNIQFSQNTQRLDEDFPMYSPPERINTPTRSSCMQYDMWGVGVLVFRLMKGQDLWAEESLMIKRNFRDNFIISKAIREKIKMEAKQVHAKVMNINQKAHPCLPGLVHLILCLLNPVRSRRAKARNIQEHALFYVLSREENDKDLMERLKTIGTQGHGCDHCVITFVDAKNILYVTTVPRGSILQSLLVDTKFLQKIPLAKEEQSPIEDDMVLQTCY